MDSHDKGAADDTWAKQAADAKATVAFAAEKTAEAAYKAAKAAAEKANDVHETAGIVAGRAKAAAEMAAMADFTAGCAAETAAYEKEESDKTAQAAWAAWKRARDVFGEYSPTIVSSEEEDTESSEGAQKAADAA